MVAGVAEKLQIDLFRNGRAGTPDTRQQCNQLTVATIQIGVDIKLEQLFAQREQLIFATGPISLADFFKTFANAIDLKQN